MPYRITLDSSWEETKKAMEHEAEAKAYATNPAEAAQRLQCIELDLSCHATPQITTEVTTVIVQRAIQQRMEFISRQHPTQRRGGRAMALLNPTFFNPEECKAAFEEFNRAPETFILDAIPLGIRRIITVIAASIAVVITISQCTNPELPGFAYWTGLLLAIGFICLSKPRTKNSKRSIQKEYERRNISKDAEKFYELLQIQAKLQEEAKDAEYEAGWSGHFMGRSVNYEESKQKYTFTNLKVRYFNDRLREIARGELEILSITKRRIADNSSLDTSAQVEADQAADEVEQRNGLKKLALGAGSGVQ